MEGSTMLKRQRMDSGSDVCENKEESAAHGQQEELPGMPDLPDMFPDVDMTAGARSLYKDQVLFDYTIEVEDKQFKVHKVIIASVSDYFRVMLTGGMKESQRDRVRLEGLMSLAVSNMIEFIYTGRLGSTRASPENLLSCAVYLQIPAAISLCTEILCDKMDSKNCFELFSLFKVHSIKDGIRAASEFIRSGVDTILKGSEQEQFGYDKFLVLMECWNKSEWDLFLCVKQWIDVDGENRQQHLIDLMSRVRFALMTPKQLESVKEMDVYSKSDGAWRQLVDKALLYHSLPEHQKVVYDSEQNTVRGEPKLAVFSSDEYSPCLLYTLQKSKYSFRDTDEWEEQQLEDAFFESGIDVAIGINNFIIICDFKTQKWHIFDPRRRKLSPMANMINPRKDATLVYCEKRLYALGGSLVEKKDRRKTTDNIEKYDFESDTWTVVPSTLPATAAKLGAGVIGGNIYVVPHKDVHDCDNEMEVRLDCYNPGTNTWSGKCPLIEPKHSHCGDLQVMELWNEEVLFIMRQGFNMQYYSPSTNQWSVFNPRCYVDTELMYTPNLHCRVLAHRNCLYLFNFPYQNDTWMSEHEKKSGCAKWTLRHRGQRIIEERLQDFEVTEDEYYKNEKQYFPALLAMV